MVEKSRAVDEYTSGIEVANACRTFYVSRLQTAEVLKSRLLDRQRTVNAPSTTSTTTASDGGDGLPTTMDSIVLQLRRELASLIDIDLQVMRQLLMLNDQLEEFKWQRRRQLQQRCRYQRKACLSTPDLDDGLASPVVYYASHKAPSTPGCWSLQPTDCMSTSLFHDNDVDEFDEEEDDVPLKYPTPSALSLLHATASHDDHFSVSGSADNLAAATATTTATGDCNVDLHDTAPRTSSRQPTSVVHVELQADAGD